MELSKTTVGMIAALCVAGGAGGAYFLAGHKSAAVSELAPVATTSGELEARSTIPASTAVATAQPRAESDGRATAAAAARPRSSSTSTARPANLAPRASSPESPATPSAAPAQARAADVPVAPAIVFDEPKNSVEPQPVTDAAPPAPEFEELVVAADSVLGLQIETSTTSDRAEVEDEVVARVTRDVRVGDRVAIPAGAKAHGEVTLVERGGKLRERARLGVRFTSVVLGDGTRIPLATNVVYREGDAPSRESAAKIGGGAVGGAIIGGILGGAKGAAIGGSLGAGAGTAATLAGGRNPATLPSGTPVTVRLAEPLTVTVER
jgi:hypothetical protein